MAPGLLDLLGVAICTRICMGGHLAFWHGVGAMVPIEAEPSTMLRLK